MLPSSLIARALSRLLSHDEGAKKLLASHAGATVQVRMPPLVTTLKIASDGSLENGEVEAKENEPTVAVEFPLTALPLIAQGQEAALRAAKISGQAALLQDMSKAFSSLPLAAEAELERVVGPILANEATRFFKALKAFGNNAQMSLEAASKRYVHDEAKLVAEREEVAKFAADIQRLRIDVQRLQSRVAKL
ncbi:MAG: ubiquinone biosynthesis accessory factor UbiJ [Casimicrobium sp.]